ncbi:MAG: iron chelate uptake ABC transporter family permease subunit, partial [Chromatiales bacterium]
MSGRLLILLLLPGLLLVTLLSLLLGSVELPPADLLSAMLFRENSLASEILWDYRLPRTLFAIVIGAMLAMAGAMMQTLLRNPLADPYILGTSGGAAVGVLAAFYLALPAWFHLVAAVAGALFSTLLLMLFSGFSRS